MHRFGCCAGPTSQCTGNRNSTTRIALRTAALLLFFAPPTLAQNISSGTVVGTVTDPSGAVMPGAEVTMTERSTKVAVKAVTNTDGRFVFPNAVPGVYDIRVAKSGFKTASVQDQSVEIGKTLTENVAMQVGQIEQTVTVETSGTDLQTMNATIGDVVSGIALESLPAVGRDVSTFAVMQPGVSPDGSVAGTVVDQASFTLDGGQNSNDMDGSMTVYTGSFSNSPGGFAAGSTPSGVIPTPIDSIEEFKVNTVGQTADFNSSSGMQVLMQTKHGANSYHGTIYEYYLDNNWNANTWDRKDAYAQNPTGVPDFKNPSHFHYNRFGSSFGGPLFPGRFLGGKTYFFGFYEGFRFPNAATYSRIVPTATMRAGVLFSGGTAYNLNPNAVTVNGVTYPGSGNTYDPRSLGINPLVSQLWSSLPLPNSTGCLGLSRCDGTNIGAFTGNVSIPQQSDLGVFRLDHDFSDKWRFYGTYHYYKFTNAGAQQVDIGGLLPGDKPGVPTSKSGNPQLPWMYTAALTTQISSTLTNDFHYSFTRNWWEWSRAGDIPQISGVAGALEPLGESQLNSLVPYNVNTQNTRTRYWDGLDNYFRDDVSWLRGNHLFQFGGIYQHNFNKHSRTDNGGGINYEPVYQLGTTSNANITLPAGVPGSSSFSRDYAAVLGIVSVSQQAFTRTGNNLALNPPLTPAFDQSTIPFYNLYASDSWRLKPSITLSYGLGWTVEMPPTEKNGKQVEFVDANNKPVSAEAYLNAKSAAALNGQAYDPIVGFSLIGNVAGHPKYPYNPYYGSFSPRVSLAWNPHFDSESLLGKITGGDRTVVRGGYGRIFGRLNGVDLVLVPLLGTGLIEPVQCVRPTITGACGSSKSAVDANNAFRIGVDGKTAPLGTAAPTLPQPFFPGVAGNQEAGAGEALDPNFRPNVVDSFTLSIQRQLNNRMMLEIGYIGRKITHEYLPVNVNVVPYMFTKGGQRFDNAYAAIEKATGFGNNIPATTVVNGVKTIAGVQAQPFFEAAMNPAFCKGYANCTTAVVDQESGNFASQDVWHLWSDLDGGGFNFGPTMLNTSGQLSSGVGVNASVGYGNYNAGYVSFRINGWKGLTFQNNFTWSKALGTGALVQATSEYTPDDAFDLHRMYGLQNFDRKFVYNAFAVYEPPFFHGQKGALGHLLGGWSIAPLFQTGTGAPIESFTINGGGAAFGEGDSTNFFSNENAIPTSYAGVSNSAHYGVTGTSAGSSGHVNIFSNPDQVFNNMRQPILGLDSNDGGFGILRGLPFWNLDLSIRKNVHITERFSMEGQIMFINVLNHMQFTDPSYDTSSPGSFGVLNTQGNTPRQMEFGLRFRF